MTKEFHVDESKPWFGKEAGWPDEVPKNLDFPDMTLGEMLDQSAKKYGDKKAIWFLETFMSFAELKGHVDRFATALHQLGVKKGDVVAILLPNSFQYVISYYALARLGAVATGVNPTYKAGEVLHQLKTVEAKGLIVLDALYEPTVAPIIGQIKMDFVIGTNIADLAHGLGFKRFLGKLLGKIPKGKMPPTALSFMKLLRTPPAVPKVDIDPRIDPATYIMTGGTTGVPKAAVLSHFNVVSNAIQSRAWLLEQKVPAGAMDIGVLPLFHSFAMTCVMNISIYAGMWMLLFPRPPATKDLLDTIMRLGPAEGSVFAGAEVLFQRIADYPEIGNYNLAGKMTLCVSGAGPLHRPVQEAFEKKTSALLVEGYGLTESSPVVSAGPFWGNRKIGTIGLPFPGTEWKIMDIETTTREMGVGEDQSGEICVAGPQVMVGYLNRPEETDETIKEWDGKKWLLTGDIGWMDEKGRVTINDRKKQLIKYKGYSVFPKEVEELVGGHEAVSEVAVAGLPDRETGEVIKAWVVLKPEFQGKLTEEELHEWCKKNLTHYKVPRYIEFRDDLPKSMVGKVLRRELQEADPLFKSAKEKK
ncbi:MAG: AMP-binding protein [Bradymonadales bacterium]|nr:AMP-binding protein [Bradymonadales bacterium]